MINRSRKVFWDGEFLFAPLPKVGKNARRMVIKVVDPLRNNHVIHANEPCTKKTHQARTRHNEIQVWHDKRLGGALKWAYHLGAWLECRLRQSPAFHLWQL